MRPFLKTCDRSTLYSRKVALPLKGMKFQIWRVVQDFNKISKVRCGLSFFFSSNGISPTAPLHYRECSGYNFNFKYPVAKYSLSQTKIHNLNGTKFQGNKKEPIGLQRPCYFIVAGGAGRCLFNSGSKNTVDCTFLESWGGGGHSKSAMSWNCWQVANTNKVQFNLLM